MPLLSPKMRLVVAAVVVAVVIAGLVVVGVAGALGSRSALAQADAPAEALVVAQQVQITAITDADGVQDDDYTVLLGTYSWTTEGIGRLGETVVGVWKQDAPYNAARPYLLVALLRSDGSVVRRIVRIYDGTFVTVLTSVAGAGSGTFIDGEVAAAGSGVWVLDGTALTRTVTMTG